MKLISIAIFMMAFYSNAQETVAEWQDANPGILFMSIENFNELSSESKNLIASRVIVFSNEPSMIDIENFEQTTAPTEAVEMHTYQNAHGEGDLIKIWLSNHPGIKIVPRSQYIESDKEDRLDYHQVGTIILGGELITLKDIEKYEANY